LKLKVFIDNFNRNKVVFLANLNNSLSLIGYTPPNATLSEK